MNKKSYHHSTRNTLYAILILLSNLYIQGVITAPEINFGSPDFSTSPPTKHEMLPVVLWHGMGDSCCNENSIGGIKTRLEDEYGI